MVSQHSEYFSFQGHTEKGPRNKQVQEEKSGIVKTKEGKGEEKRGFERRRPILSSKWLCWLSNHLSIVYPLGALVSPPGR